MPSQPYTGPERRVMEQERIRRLEAATNHLAGQVQGLSAALETVNRISARQQELEQETRIATAALKSVTPKVQQLESEIVPRKEHRFRDQERWILTGGAVIVAVHTHEIARNACGGHRMEHPGTIAEMGTTRQVVCDVAWPEATNQGTPYPSAANYFGMVLYVILLVAMATRLRTIHRRAGRDYRYYEH
jgi:hypothetical protein